MLSPLEFIPILSTITFINLLVIYHFRIGIQVNYFRKPVFISALVFSIVLNTALIFLLSLYTFVVNFSTCFLFCNAVGDPEWKYLWIGIVGGISVLSIAAFLSLQSTYISGYVLLSQGFSFWKGVGLLGLVNILVWLAIAEFKLLGVFKSYHGSA